MKWPFRRRRAADPVIDKKASELVAAVVPLPVVTSPAQALDPELRAKIDEALAPFPVEKARSGAFFGVPIEWFTKDELIQIISWVAVNSRDHRRDS